MYDIQHLKNKIKELRYELNFKNSEIKRLQNTLTTSSIADLKIDNDLLKKELKRFQHSNQYINEYQESDNEPNMFL